MEKVAQDQRAPSQALNVDRVRKRVCRACDRCRLKKSKCNGSQPCSRCEIDNAICAFGQRRKLRDKVYPKGYVEVLERQQGQLVAALQEMYRRLRSAQAWTGSTLPEPNGHPFTHDILASLNLLERKQDGSGETATFEDNCQNIQLDLLGSYDSNMQERNPVSTDSDHSQHSPLRTATQVTPTLTKQPVFEKYLAFTACSYVPLSQSPVQGQMQRHPPPQALPPQACPTAYDPLLYQAESADSDLSNPVQFIQSSWGVPGSEPNMDLIAIESILGQGQCNIIAVE